ncbi:RHS repeat-associated core domain-containing protein, partial [Maricaulis salignorans]
TGHITDTDTGMVYMQARYYDPAIGRFLSGDPVGFAQGGVGYFNRYAYVGNNPVNATDPTGEFGNLAIGFIVGLAAGGIDAGIQAYTTRNEVGGPRVDWGQSGRTALVAGATTALGPLGGAAVSALGSGIEAGLDSAAAGHSAAETTVNVLASAAIGGTVARLTGGAGTKATAGLAVREMAGGVPAGSAISAQQSIAAGTGVLVATAISEGLDTAVELGGQGLDAAASTAGALGGQLYDAVMDSARPDVDREP